MTIMKVFPKDQVQKIQPSRSNPQNSSSTWGFLKNGKSMDFSNKIDSNQENTQDRFLYVPATFLPKKNQSKWLGIKIHEIEQNAILRSKIGEKGR
jgi:hypothetical protein